MIFTWIFRFVFDFCSRQIRTNWCWLFFCAFTQWRRRRRRVSNNDEYFAYVYPVPPISRPMAFSERTGKLSEFNLLDGWLAFRFWNDFVCTANETKINQFVIAYLPWWSMLMRKTSISIHLQLIINSRIEQWKKNEHFASFFLLPYSFPRRQT